MRFASKSGQGVDPLLLDTELLRAIPDGCKRFAERPVSGMSKDDHVVVRGVGPAM